MQKRNIILLIVIIIIVATVLLGGFFVYQYFLIKSQSTVQLQQNQNAGWKTYRNDEQGFQLNYPQEFVPDENSNYPASGDVIATFRRPSYGDWSFSVAGPYYNSSLGRNETYNEAVQSVQKLFGNYKNFQQKSISVAGKKSQEFSYLDKDPVNTYKGDIEHMLIYIPKEGGDYVAFNWKSSEDISATQAVQNSKSQLDQVLPTFKFTK